MPHIQIEYSANVDHIASVAGLCEILRATAVGIDALPMPGIRVRAIRVDHVAIADGDPMHNFVDISVRLRAGRSHAIKADICQRLFAAAEAFLNPTIAEHSLALSLELRDIDADLSPKTGSIRKHLKVQNDQT